MTQPPKEPNPFDTSFILAVPLFHVTGLVPVMLSCFTNGFKLVMMYKWTPERALELIERERVTQFVGVPTMTIDLLECPDFASRDTSSLAQVGGGGAPAPRARRAGTRGGTRRCLRPKRRRARRRRRGHHHRGDTADLQ